MSDNDSEAMAAWAFQITIRIAIYVLFGVFIIIVLLFQRFPKFMVILLGLSAVAGIGFALVGGNTVKFPNLGSNSYLGPATSTPAYARSTVLPAQSTPVSASRANPAAPTVAPQALLRQPALLISS